MAHGIQSFSALQSGSAAADAWHEPNVTGHGDDVNLVNEIRALQADRQRHADAIAKIDSTLTRIGKMLATVLHPDDPSAGAPRLTPAAARPTSKRPHKYRKLPLKAHESVLN